MNAHTEMPRTSGDFQPKNVVVLVKKNERTEVWAYESEFKGKPNFHIREVYIDGASGQWRPGKGVSMPLEARADAIAKLLDYRGQ